LENLIRLSIAVGVFTVMVTWEYFSPRRKQHIARTQRWPINLGLAVCNMVLMRLSIGSLAYTTALSAGERGYGLLNWLQVPEAAAIVITLLTLDFAIYGQHIVMHKIPLLWRLHKIHHSDLEFDATTAVRFHPLEIVLSMLYKTLWIILIGAHPVAVIAFEVILNAAATFNHSNVTIPVAIDKMLRWLLITPDAHRIHHSAEPSETDSNYGFSISWWDRLCGTYTAEPKLPQTELLIGLKPYPEQAGLNFNRLLLIPFESNSK
jgi:sterol desaturase/sphingolipid hydroxylase (fatty acid hydroxylase superfamily)